MALWKVAVIFLFVYVCFDGVKSYMVEPVDEKNVDERFLKLEKEILRLKSVIQYEHNTRLNGNTRGWDVGGTTTVTQLVRGESVWVEGEGTANGRYNGAWRYHSTFSGVLLYEV
ncbi:hypothetical protein ACF0H5_003982 [Mactra antiquata]